MQLRWVDIRSSSANTRRYANTDCVFVAGTKNRNFFATLSRAREARNCESQRPHHDGRRVQQTTPRSNELVTKSPTLTSSLSGRVIVRLFASTVNLIHFFPIKIIFTIMCYKAVDMLVVSTRLCPWLSRRLQPCPEFRPCLSWTLAAPCNRG